METFGKPWILDMNVTFMHFFFNKTKGRFKKNMHESILYCILAC